MPQSSLFCNVIRKNAIAFPTLDFASMMVISVKQERPETKASKVGYQINERGLQAH